ncbi:MAG: WYL domain-containing protein, partial [Peptostreptococcaceae bacterium]
KLEIKELKGGFNPFTYSKKTFKMFDGKEDYVEIEFKHNILNFLVSEFREDIKITKLDNGSYRGVFIGKIGYGLMKWILQFGSSVKVIKPKELVDDIKKEIKILISMY